jgi:hypothetical protein
MLAAFDTRRHWALREFRLARTVFRSKTLGAIISASLPANVEEVSLEKLPYSNRYQQCSSAPDSSSDSSKQPDDGLRAASGTRATRSTSHTNQSRRPMAHYTSERYADPYDHGERPIHAIGSAAKWWHSDRAKRPLSAHRAQHHRLYCHRLVAQDQDRPRPLRNSEPASL